MNVKLKHGINGKKYRYRMGTIYAIGKRKKKRNS